MTTQPTSALSGFLNPIIDFAGETLDRGKEYLWSEWFQQEPEIKPVAEPQGVPTAAERSIAGNAQMPFGMSPMTLGLIGLGGLALIVLLKD